MIAGSIKRPIAVAMAYFSIALLGVAAFRKLPVELLPDISLPRLTVAANWPGASPEVTEAFLTSPLEASIQQVRGVEKVTSRSSPEAASIEVTFARDTDMDFARLDLSERLAALAEHLPPGASPPTVSQYVPEQFAQQNQAELSYTITGPYVLDALRQDVEDRLKPQLVQVTGVGDVEVTGGRRRELRIELDEAKIRALGLRVDAVRSRLMSMQITEQAGAAYSDDGLLRPLAIRERAESVPQIEQLPLLVDQGRIVRVRDVGRVVVSYEDPQSYYRINGDPAIAFHIYRQPLANTVRMADSVKAKLAELAPGLPAGERLFLDSDQSREIRAQLTDLGLRSLISAVIVLLVLILFLQSLSAAIIVFSTVAFSVLITLNVAYFLGMTLNVLTLMGLAMGFGLVVDNAIVVLENIFRRRKLGEAAQIAAEKGAREVFLAILAATGTTVIVVVPFVYLQGNLRVYYVPLAIVVGIALIASMLVAFTFIPALGARLLHNVTPGGIDRTQAGALPWIARVYSGLIRLTLRFPWSTAVVTLLMLFGSFTLFNKYVTRGTLWGGFGGQDNYISIQIRQQRGEELERTNDLVRFFEERLKEMPEVEKFVSRVQSRDASIRVTFPDSIENTSIPVAIKETLYQYSVGYGGTDVHVYGYGPSFYGGGGGPPNYSIKVLGYNYEKVREIAEDLASRLKNHARIKEVDTNSSGSFYDNDRATELIVDVDRARLGLYDLTVRELVSQVSAAVRGRSSRAVMNVAGEETQFSVKLAGYDKIDLYNLRELLLPATGGQAVRLGDVANVTERRVLNQVVREDQQYQRMVTYEFRGPAKLGDKVRKEAIEATALPPGYTISEDRGYYFSAEEGRQIYGVLIIAIILIYMVTAAVFESFRQPLCVLLTVPMALIGVFLLFFYIGASFTREAYIGVIMMSGVVVNNAILLIDHVNQLRRRDGMPLREALELGTLQRVRPILMTSIVTIAGLLPLVLFSKDANANIWNALTYAMIGGLSSSTILVLTVTPSLYLIFERRPERKALERAAAEQSLTVTV
ncbi:MAG TPA: efflux RND transporter permease subunit [Longimicrobiales bacterium]